MNQKSAVVSFVKQEPATAISLVTAFLTEVFGLAVAFGLGFSPEQQAAIISTVTATAGLIAFLGPAIRQFVTPTAKAQAAIDAAYQATPGKDEKPTLV